MPQEVIHVHDQFYILSTSPRIDDRTRVLKHGDTFAVFDRFGDIESFGTGGLGLYHQDTRFLSRLVLRVEGSRPLLLNSTIKDFNDTMAIDAMNADIHRDPSVSTPRGTVHLFRAKFLWNGTCYERMRAHNFGQDAVDLRITVAFDADFADIFEARGAKRERRGTRLPTVLTADTLLLAYDGLDGRSRSTHIGFAPAPTQLTETEACYDLHLEPGEDREMQFAISCEVRASGAPAPAGVPRQPESHDKAVLLAASARETVRAGYPEIETSDELVNDWIKRSVADLAMMETTTRYGLYPYAGVPWFCTPFGRDGIITALECLSFNPDLARGVLRFLAANQATTVSAENDAQPGKVLHEARAGEMAALGEVPFRQYYGSVDATPLFLILAGACFERTGDLAFLQEIWPNVQQALGWIDKYGDLDGDGFVEYARQSIHGLVQQGWKDSHDSVFHADGTAAKAPIALCEVQGYVYAARLAVSAMATAVGDTKMAEAQLRAAERLRLRFEEEFWCEELATYALALDGEKKACRVRASNAGHCLYTGLVSAERARLMAATLGADASFSGWGIRTVAAGESRFNPMSYHNGSIWPHDNAVIAAGLARYGLKDEAVRVFTALAEASAFFDLHRLPELFCGFPRRPGEPPTLYPVACAPQAWASGAVFLLLESCLGMRVQGSPERVVFMKPVLPAMIKQLTIRYLRAGSSTVDLLIVRHDSGDVSVTVLRREGEVEVSLVT